MDEQKYISPQITKYMTNKGLIEFNDHMNSASTENYAHIHAVKEESAGGSRLYSRIGVVIQDYSKGTGDKCVRVKASLMPEEVKLFYSVAQKNPMTFNYPALSDDGKATYQTKIFGKPNEEGRCQVTKFRLARQAADKDGVVRKLPWAFEIQNGTGIKVSTKIGGFYMQGESFKLSNKAFILMSDFDFFFQMCKVAQFISIWEMTMGAALIRQGRKALEEYYNSQKAAA
jgi:hypothetical protein